MWNLKSSNKILDIKWKKDNQRKHLDALRNMKSQINTTSPNKYPFLESRQKAHQQKKCSNVYYSEKER
jgi:uncharacterized membrane protein YfhO